MRLFTVRIPNVVDFPGSPPYVVGLHPTLCWSMEDALWRRERYAFAAGSERFSGLRFWMSDGVLCGFGIQIVWRTFQKVGKFIPARMRLRRCASSGALN